MLDATGVVERHFREKALQEGGLLFLSHGFEHKIEGFDPLGAGEDRAAAIADFGSGETQGANMTVLG